MEEGYQRHNAHLVAALSPTTDDENIPHEILLFRKIIGDIKLKIMESCKLINLPDNLSSAEEKSLQDPELAKHASVQINNLGQIITLIINSTSENNKEIETVRDEFKRRGFDFESLTPHIRDLCMIYINNDINVGTFSIIENK